MGLYPDCAASIAQNGARGHLARRVSGRLRRQPGVPLWKENRGEGGSIYFLDSDGHRLEAQVGELAGRLAQSRRAPYPDMQFFDPS
ncbi:MAG: hypothetical protein V4582_01430 [Pseudomonadota bacterium]